MIWGRLGPILTSPLCEQGREDGETNRPIAPTVSTRPSQAPTYSEAGRQS